MASKPSLSFTLTDFATKRKEDVGMPSYFSPAATSIPPLVDVPQELVSLVLYGGFTPTGEGMCRFFEILTYKTDAVYLQLPVRHGGSGTGRRYKPEQAFDNACFQGPRPIAEAEELHDRGMACPIPQIPGLRTEAPSLTDG
jgi:hypothetical protein